MKIPGAARLVSGLLATAMGVASQMPAAASPEAWTATSPEAARSASTAKFTDNAGDVRKPELDIRDVTVVNRPDRLKIRVSFPGVAEKYDFPTGAVIVYLDTDEQREGPEYGHFMDFWSDYRFAPTSDWMAQRVRTWSHSPEGRCVADAGVRSDKQSRLQWFEYTVVKRKGCFDADAVRVSVSTVNTGELRPFREYRRPVWDHLGSRHAWTSWIAEAS